MKAALCMLVLLGTLGAAVQAAETTAGAAEPDSALVDSIVRKLESSGALDAAVTRAIGRYAQLQRQAEEAKKQPQSQSQSQGQSKDVRPVDPRQDHIRGNSFAEVSLIEYVDFECPFCKRFHGVPKELLERYGGRVNWVMRNFPLPFHNPAARKEALAAECVAQLGGNDPYWKYADALFASTRSGGSGLPDDKPVDKLAATIGVDGPALTKCMSEDNAAKRIDQDLADGTRAGVTGTPTTFVRNNRTGASETLVGALPAERVVAAIERLLKTKR